MTESAQTTLLPKISDGSCERLTCSYLEFAQVLFCEWPFRDERIYINQPPLHITQVGCSGCLLLTFDNVVTD